MNPPNNDQKLALEVFEEIRFKDIIEPIWFNFKLIVTLLVATVVVMVIYTHRLPDVYTATTQVMILQSDDRERLSVVRETSTWTRPSSVNTIVEIIRSIRPLANAARDLGLDKQFPNQDSAGLASKIAPMVKVRNVENTNLFNIAVTSPDPEFSMRLANAVAQNTIRMQVESDLVSSTSYLELMPFLQDSTIPSEQIYIKFVNEKKENLLWSLPSVTTDKVFSELRGRKYEEEIKLSELLKIYKEKHPRVIEARSTMKNLDDLMREHVIKTLDLIRSTLIQQMKISNVRIIYEASVPKRPSGPNRPGLIFKISMMELIGSCLVIVIFSYFNQTINSDKDLEKVHDLPNLGILPVLNTKEVYGASNIAQFVHLSPHSKFSEMMRNIRVSIDFSIDREEEKVLLITSALPEEGKSAFSTNLAISYASDEQSVVLIDADLRRPTMAKNLGLEPKFELIHYLTAQKSLDDVIFKSKIPNLSCILTKMVAPNPVEILNSKRMSQLIELLAQRFDKVIIDSPPVMGLSDSLVLASKCHVSMVVVRSRKTPLASIKKTMMQLKIANAKVIGAIINCVDNYAERYYYADYRYSYSKYHTKPVIMPAE